MKQRFIKPGFELVFALSIIAIMGLPPLVFGQSRNVEINITNGDTVVNGKNIKDLSPADRKQALKDIQHLGDSFAGDHAKHRIFIRKRGSDTGKRNIIIEKRMHGDGDMAEMPFEGDSSVHKYFNFRHKGP